MEKRERHIDCFKGICMIMVIITHLAWKDEERHAMLFPFWIDMAVPLFMMMSGYAFVRSYEKKQVNTFSETYSVQSITSRVLRFTVPFFIAFVLEETYFLHKGVQFSFALVRDLFFCFLQGGVGYGSYYYPIMIQFIFVFPVIFFLVRKHWLKGVVTVGFINAVYELLQRAYGMNDGLYRLLLFRYLLVIAVGCYAAMHKEKYVAWKLILSWITGFLFIVAIRYWNYQPTVLVYWTGTSFLACLYVIPLGLLGFRHLKRFHFGPLELIGKASFHIFLAQMVWFACISWKVTELIPNRAICFGISLLASIILGLMFYIVETPITKKIMGLLYKK